MAREPGKLTRGLTYIHRDYEDELPEDLSALRSELPVGFEYDVVKYDPSGPVTFARVRDFDGEPEPALAESCRVTREGKVSCREYRDNPPIYHGKWRMVGPDYGGFDVGESRERERRWRRLGLDPLRIGRRDYWEREALPLLEGAGRDPGEVEEMRRTGRKGGATASNPVVTRHLRCSAYPGDASVLDFGAGRGALQALELAADYPRISAYDFPGTLLETAWEDPSLAGRLELLPERGAHDIVMASNVLNVQPSRASLEATLDELAAALAPGGELVANIPSAPIKLGASQSELVDLAASGLEGRLGEGSVEVLGEVCGEPTSSKLIRAEKPRGAPRRPEGNGRGRE